MGKFMSTRRRTSYEETQYHLGHLQMTIGDAIDSTNGLIAAVDSTLLNYDNAAVDRKVENWLTTQRVRFETAKIREHQFAPAARDCYETKLRRIARTMKDKLCRDYNEACAELQEFRYSVSELAYVQQEIEEYLSELNNLVPDKMRQCRRKMAPLRVEVIKNVRESEKNEIEFKKIYELLYEQLVYLTQVLEIDKIVGDQCTKKVDKIIDNKDFY